MASRTRRKSSTVRYEGAADPGCMAGVLHMFDFHQRFRIRKMLTERRHGEGRRPSGMRNQVMQKNIPAPTSEEHDIGVNAESPSIGDNSIPTASTSCESPKESPNEHNEKRSIRQLSSRLMRTSSIHHHLPIDVDSMEKTGGGFSSDKESISPVSSKNSTHCAHCDACGSPREEMHKEHDHLDQLSSWPHKSILEEKLNEAKLALLKQLNSSTGDAQNGMAVNQAKEFLGALELLNANKDIFLKILQDPTSLSATDLQDIRSPTQDSLLTKSDSFTRSESFSRASRAPNDKSSLRHERKHEHGMEHDTPEQIDCAANILGVKYNSVSEFQLDTSQNPGEKSSGRKAQHHFKNIKARIKDIIKENKDEMRRISMDGILHKVPYGQKVSQDAAIERKQGTGFRRSRSLNESLDKYAQLSQSNISHETDKNTSQNTQLVGADNVHVVKNSSKNFQRIQSLPDIKSYLPLMDAQYSEMESKFHITPNHVPIDTAIANSSNVKNIGPPHNQNEESRMLIEDPNVESETSAEEFDELEPRMIDFNSEDGFNTDILRVSIKDKEKFNYVKDVLSKSDLRHNNFLSWHPSHLPMDPSLFMKLEESMIENRDSFSPCGHEINLDRLLLFDLINEVLLEIYDASFVLSPWFSHLKKVLRGSAILEEVWENIGWHLNFQAEANMILEPVIERDMARDEGWNDVRYEKESLGMELEEWILDDLLDEEIMEILLT